MAATVASGTTKSSTFLSQGLLFLSTSTDLPASSNKPAWQHRLVTFGHSPTDVESGFTEHHACCKSHKPGYGPFNFINRKRRSGDWVDPLSISSHDMNRMRCRKR